MRKKSLNVKSKNQGAALFDLEDIHDLPDECKKEIQKSETNRFHDKTIKLLGLFKYKSPLTVREMVAGMYRLHQITVSRLWAMSTPDNLVSKKIIQKVDKATYKTVLAVPPAYRDLA